MISKRKMELVVSVFDELPRPFFQHLASCKGTFVNATFYVHSNGSRSHLTTGREGFKRVNAGWFAPPFGTSKWIPNKGDEALAYTSYILDRYNTLPARVAFVHAHVSSWHSHSLCEYLRTAAHINERFYSFNRNNAVRECQRLSNESHGWALRAYQNWNSWFDETPPAYVHYKCCAQFMASKKSIRRHPLQTWRKVHSRALDYEDADPEKLPFEYLWPSILGASKARTPCR